MWAQVWQRVRGGVILRAKNSADWFVKMYLNPELPKKRPKEPRIEHGFYERWFESVLNPCSIRG
jgi:hypothetical protein